MNKQLTPQQWGMMIGQKVSITRGTASLVKIIKCVRSDFIETSSVNSEIQDGTFQWYPVEYCKPILQTLDQMTEEEMIEFKSMLPAEMHNANIKFDETDGFLVSSNTDHDYLSYSIDHVDWLTRKGFDIRNWIEDGLAIKYDKEEHGEWR